MTQPSQLTPSSARRVTIADGAIAALQAGPDDGEAVLLIPGFTGSKEDFAPLFDRLAEAGYHSTAVDLPGQYESRAASDPAGYTTAALGEMVRAVLRELGGAVHLVGHSFGGLVARSAVIAEPSLAADVVLMSSGPAGLQGTRRQRIERLRPLLPSGIDAVYAATQTAIEAEDGYVAPPAELAAFLRRRFLAGSTTMLGAMGSALCDEPDRVDELRATGVPTLVVTGEHDDAWMPDVQRAMADRLGSRQVIITQAAHSPAVENPAETVAELLRFWRR